MGPPSYTIRSKRGLPIIGVKSKDFADWCEVAELIKNKAHLTAEDLKKIKKKIKVGMNTGIK